MRNPDQSVGQRMGQLLTGVLGVPSHHEVSMELMPYINLLRVNPREGLKLDTDNKTILSQAKYSRMLLYCFQRGNK